MCRDRAAGKIRAPEGRSLCAAERNVSLGCLGPRGFPVVRHLSGGEPEEGRQEGPAAVDMADPSVTVLDAPTAFGEGRIMSREGDSGRSTATVGCHQWWSWCDCHGSPGCPVPPWFLKTRSKVKPQLFSGEVPNFEPFFPPLEMGALSLRHCCSTLFIWEELVSLRPATGFALLQHPVKHTPPPPVTLLSLLS